MAFLRDDGTVGYFVFYNISWWELLILPDETVQNPFIYKLFDISLMLKVGESEA